MQQALFLEYLHGNQNVTWDKSLVQQQKWKLNADKEPRNIHILYKVKNRYALKVLNVYSVIKRNAD
jgi:hypothetical protein